MLLKPFLPKKLVTPKASSALKKQRHFHPECKPILAAPKQPFFSFSQKKGFCSIAIPLDAVKDAQTGSQQAAPAPQPESLEIEDANIIFQQVWEKLEAKYGKSNLRFPKEIIWLMGAPGAGKSFNAPWILKVRGITEKEVVISSLLNTPEAEKIKKEAGLVSNTVVVEILLQTLLSPKYSNGVIIDGFPRTKVQVEVIKLLRDKMGELYQDFLHNDHGSGFVRPKFHIAVLFVDEKLSTERQLQRGRDAAEHNAKIRAGGKGELKEERATDFSEELARKRYAIFYQHYSTLQELKKHFAFHVIDTAGDVDSIREKIRREFVYQSSQELADETFSVLRAIPLASEITKHSRQNLVKRLDLYHSKHHALFTRVVTAIQKEFIPIIEEHVLAGNALIKTDNPLFELDLATEMALDILSERGYHVSARHNQFVYPTHVDLHTGRIKCATDRTHIFTVKFKTIDLREEEVL